MNNNIELITLTIKYKNQYLKMVKENGEDLKKTGFYYRFPLSTEDTFENDIETLNNRSKGIGLPEGNTFIFYFLSRRNVEGAVLAGTVTLSVMICYCTGRLLEGLKDKS